LNFKILQANNYHFNKGGSDRYFLDLVSSLKKRGCDVNTFSTFHENNVHLDWMLDSNHKVLNTSKFTSLGQIKSFFYNQGIYDSLMSSLGQSNYDVAHLHIIYGQLSSSIFSALRKNGVPIVQSLHDLKLICPAQISTMDSKICNRCSVGKYMNGILNKCRKGSYLNSLLAVAENYTSLIFGQLNDVDMFIAMSNFQRTLLVSRGVPKEKIQVIHHGIECEGEPQLKEFEKIILYAGRVERDKGIEVLIRAFTKLGLSSWTLRVAGSGSDIESMRSLAINLGIESQVQWLGLLSNHQLDKEYKDCAIFVNPSMLLETFGLTLIEAMRFGKAIIASRIGAFIEVVEEGVSGILFEPGNVDELCNHLTLLIEDNVRREELGAEGFLRVKKYFSREKHINKLLNLYNEVIRSQSF